MEVLHGEAACQKPALREKVPPLDNPKALCPIVPSSRVVPLVLVPPPPATTVGLRTYGPPCCCIYATDAKALQADRTSSVKTSRLVIEVDKTFMEIPPLKRDTNQL